MSIAIAFGDMEDINSVSGAIYLSATTTYNRKYSGRVSEHPLESGVSVSDHYTSHNPIYNISGVISSVDFSNIPSMLVVDGQPILNNQSSPDIVSVNNTGGSLMSFIPASITQFIPKTLSLDVNMSVDVRDNKAGEVEDLLKELMGGLYYSEERGKWENRMTPSKLFVIEGVSPNPPIENLVFTDVSVTEDENSGEELFVSMTLEQVRFVTLQDAEAPKPQPKSATAVKTAPDIPKGEVPSGASGKLSDKPKPKDKTYADKLEEIRNDRL